MTRYPSLFFSALTLSLLLSFTSQAWSQDDQLTEPSALPEPIQHLKNKGLDIVRKFPVDASLTGWVVNYEGSDMIVYTTNNGEFLINGVLLDAQGNDLTENHQKNWIPRPSWEIGRAS